MEQARFRSSSEGSDMSKKIVKYIPVVGVSEYTGRVRFEFADGSSFDTGLIPSDRYTAILATLQATPEAFMNRQGLSGPIFIVTAPDTPGP